MMFSDTPWLVLTVFAVTIFWLVLCAYFFHYLKKFHPHEYLALGEPGFKVNGGSLWVIAYIFRRGHRPLGDRRLSVLCDLMAVCFSAVIILITFSLVRTGRLPSWEAAN
jgi:hypothetical protein